MQRDSLQKSVEPSIDHRIDMLCLAIMVHIL